MKIIGIIIQGFFILIMTGVVGLFLIPFLPIDNNIELRIVQSGSMEPSIETGALVIVRPTAEYGVGDVITFSDRYSQIPTTHRILEAYQDAGQTWFVTKGDANEEADAMPVMESSVLGKVVVDVPRVGYILDFTRQPVGFMLLIVLPAFLIVLSELEKIWRELRGRRQTNNDDDHDDGSSTHSKDVWGGVQPVAISDRPGRMMDIATPVRYLELPTLDLRRFIHLRAATHVGHAGSFQWVAVASVLVFGVAVVGSSLLGHTVSYFHDSEASSENALTAIALDFTATSDSQTLSFAPGGAVGSDGEVVLTILPEAGSADLRYEVSTAAPSWDDPLCAVLLAAAPSPVDYDGLLESLSANDIFITDSIPFTFAVGDEGGLVGGEQCDVDLIFTAWHEEEAADEGFYDSEIVTLQFLYLPTVTIQTISPTSLLAEISEASLVPEGASDETVLVADETKEKSSGGSGSGAGKDEKNLPSTPSVPVEERKDLTAEERKPEPAGQEGKQEEDSDTEGDEVVSDGEVSSGSATEPEPEGKEVVIEEEANESEEIIEEEETKEQADVEGAPADEAVVEEVAVEQVVDEAENDTEPEVSAEAVNVTETEVPAEAGADPEAGE